MHFRFNSRKNTSNVNKSKNILFYMFFAIFLCLFISYFCVNKNINIMHCTERIISKIILPKFLAGKMQNSYIYNDKELQKEIDADKSYYESICNDCIYHKDKIEQNIKEGADADWWNYMCSDFCKEYAQIKN